MQDVCARASAVVARRKEQVGIRRAQKETWRALKSLQDVRAGCDLIKYTWGGCVTGVGQKNWEKENIFIRLSDHKRKLF